MGNYETREKRNVNILWKIKSKQKKETIQLLSFMSLEKGTQKKINKITNIVKT